MGFGEPILEANNFTYDDIPKIYEQFHLFDTDISTYLEQFELEQNSIKHIQSEDEIVLHTYRNKINEYE